MENILCKKNHNELIIFFVSLIFTGDGVYVESCEGYLRLAKIEKIWTNERYSFKIFVLSFQTCSNLSNHSPQSTPCIKKKYSIPDPGYILKFRNHPSDIYLICSLIGAKDNF